MRYHSTTGLTKDEIDELVRRIWQVLGPRPVSGRPAALGLYRQVLLTLVLLRQNLTQSAAGDLFGVSQATVSRIYRRMLPLLEQVTCLHRPGELAELTRGRVVLIDGTDVPTGNRAGARHNYSGKRHRQGLNVQIAATLDGDLLAVSDPVPGSWHDRRAIRETGWEPVLDDGICWIADPGYQGTTALHPTKKPRHGNLTEDRKHANTIISGYRSAVERAIAHLKNWKILATGYRGYLVELPNVIRIVTRLEYFRLGW